MRTGSLRQLRSGLFFTAVFLGSTSAFAQLPHYNVVDLGTLGGRVTEATDLNDVGQVTGYSETDDGQFRAFLYVDGEMRDLGEIASGGSIGHALNAAGSVAGLTAAPDGLAHAFRHEAGVMTDLGAAGRHSSGNDINNVGDIAGEAVATDGTLRAVIFRASGVVDLGAPAGSSATAINEAGQAVGNFEDDAIGPRAFLFDGAAFVDLVPGRPSFVLGIQPINAAGQVAGAFQADDTLHCFLFHNGQRTDPGSLGGGYCFGTSVNASGAMTGVSATADLERHAFIASGGTMTDLGALSGGLSIGHAINDTGDVAGEATVAEGGSHAFVYANGELQDLTPLLQNVTSLPVTDSVAFDINSSGQVLGRFTVSDPSDPLIPLQSRAFLATPFSTVFDKLLALVTGVGPGQSLVNKVTEAREAYVAQDGLRTCSVMKAFSNEVRAQTGKQIDVVRAVLLQAEAVTIRSALGCA